MDVAKRLDFEPTEPLDVIAEAKHAVEELQKAVHDLSATTSQKQAQILALAKQSAEQGIGDNDLKRLKRQFDSNKATFVNIDQKQRFMRGLYDVELNIDKLSAIKNQHEQQQETESERLRSLKAQNEQARTNLASTSASVGQLYSLVEQATAATTAQLAATTNLLQHHASRRTPVNNASTEPGPGLVEAQGMVEAETTQIKELERSIAAAETELSELESKASAGRVDLAALRTEVERLEALASNVARAADVDSHIRDATQWCDDLLFLMSQLGGLSIASSSGEQLILGIRVKVPTSTQTGCTSVRELQHELTFQLLSHSAAAGGVVLAGAHLSPDVPPIRAFLDAAVDGSDITPAYIVAEVRRRLLSYWQSKVLVEEADEA